MKGYLVSSDSRIHRVRDIHVPNNSSDLNDSQVNSEELMASEAEPHSIMNEQGASDRSFSSGENVTEANQSDESARRASTVRDFRKKMDDLRLRRQQMEGNHQQ
jgi:hypothetical protein